MELNLAGSQVPSGGYDPSAFAALFGVEDRHFWFRARNALIEGIAANALAKVPVPSILEIGCGTGSVLRSLGRVGAKGRVVGLDFHADGLAYARRRCAVPLVQADVNLAPFSIRFDLVGMFDVLEHIPDDLAALKCANSLVKPGGTLLITVPAHKSLWSYADDFAMHCRRYENSELCEKLVCAGFEIRFVSPFMALLYPALRLWRYMNGSGSETSNQQFRRDLTIVPVLNDLAALVMSFEARWVAARRRLPFGASLVALAVKPEKP